MGNSYLVSVIIPIFNAEKYIEKCISSLMEQTMTAADVEFIFIDDYSTDNSVQLLREQVERYHVRKPHTHIIQHTRNRGVAAVRNTGLDMAQGKYIAWADSDDWLELNILERLLGEAEEKQLDMVWCSHYLEWSGGQMIINQPYTDKETYLDDVLCGKIEPVLWNRLIKKSLLDLYRFRFIEGCNISEDKSFVFKVACVAERIEWVTQPLYHYVRNENSITSNSSSYLIYQEIENAKDLVGFINSDRCKCVLNGRSITLFKLLSKKNLLFSFTRADYEYWSGIFREVNWSVFAFGHFDLKYKAIAFFSIMRCWFVIDFWLFLKRRYYKRKIN